MLVVIVAVTIAMWLLVERTQAFVVVVTAIVIATLLLATLLRRSVIRPMHDVREITTAIAEGAIAERIHIPASASEEVRRMATAVNRMAEKASTDISELRRLERVRSEFVANVSHELRTPIFSVQGYLETLLDGALEDPDVSRPFLEKAYSNAMRLNALLSDLIDISRIESGELRLSFRYFNIASVLQDLVQTMEIRAIQRSVHVLLDERMSDDVMVYGDKERLSQVLTNLIDNAIKYNVPNGQVIVSARRQGEEVTVRIADTGIGIPKDHVARIFERFYRVDKDRSRAVGGTGLGLAIVKHILEAHQSHVYVESDQGKGTTITFTLRAGE
ncbi:hypothetical protein BH10BAC6_BH10BAC6_13110 [soil metagenome]